MKQFIHEKSPFTRAEEEAMILSVDEYHSLSELFEKLKYSFSSKEVYLQDDLLHEIESNYIDRFYLDSKIVIHFNNWNKTSINSDSYMSLISTLRRMTKSVSDEDFFLNVMP